MLTHMVALAPALTCATPRTLPDARTTPHRTTHTLHTKVWRSLSVGGLAGLHAPVGCSPPQVGHESRLMLSGAGDGALLLASFGEIKAVLEKSFREPASAGSPS